MHTETIAARVDSILQRGVPRPISLPTVQLCQRAKEKLHEDNTTGVNTFRNEWCGFAASNC